MNNIMDKKILVFLNNHFNTNISHLEKNYNTTYIFTDTLINVSDEYIISIKLLIISRSTRIN